MIARVLTGSKHEIARQLASLDGEVREAIVFLEDEAGTESSVQSTEDMFAEMEPYTVRVGGADYSRAGIYSRKAGD